MEQLDKLPDEVLLNIFNFFNKHDLGRSSIVNKKFYAISKHKSLQNLPCALLDYSQPPYAIKTLIDNQDIHDSVITSKEKIVFTSLLKELPNTEKYVTQIYDIEKNEYQILERSITNARSKFFPLANGHIIDYQDIWDISRNCIIKTLPFTETITALTELPNGNVVSASTDLTLRVWNIERGECLASISFLGFSGPFYNLITLSNGHILSSSENGLLDIWDITNEYKHLYSIFSCETIGSKIYSLVELPTGEVLSGYYGGSLALWDITNKKCLDIFHREEFIDGCISKLIVLPNKKQVACLIQTASSSKIQIWDIETRKYSHNLSKLNDNANIKSFRVLPNAQIATTSNRGLMCWFFPELNLTQNTVNNLNCKPM